MGPHTSVSAYVSTLRRFFEPVSLPGPSRGTFDEMRLMDMGADIRGANVDGRLMLFEVGGGTSVSLRRSRRRRCVLGPFSWMGGTVCCEGTSLCFRFGASRLGRSGEARGVGRTLEHGE